MNVRASASETWGGKQRKRCAYADGNIIRAECKRRQNKLTRTPDYNLQMFSPHQDEVTWKRTPKGTPKPTLQTLTARVTAKVRKRLHDNTYFCSPRKKFARGDDHIPVQATNEFSHELHQEMLPFCDDSTLPSPHHDPPACLPTLSEKVVKGTILQGPAKRKSLS